MLPDKIIWKNDKNFELHINVFSFLDTDSHLYITYIPSLDIVIQGEDRQSALKSAEIAVKESIKYAIKKKTLGKWLDNMGWKRIKTRKYETVPNKKTLPRNKSLQSTMLQIA